MSKPNNTKPCALCGKDVPQEAELQLFKHFLNYTDAEGSLVHSCKSKAFYEARSRKAKSSKVERAVATLIEHPRNKRAAAVLQQFRSEKLLEQAGKPGVSGLAAANKLMREYIGEPTAAPEIDVIVMPEELAAERLKSIPVRMIESKQKPVSKPSVTESKVSEPTRRGADDPRPPGVEERPRLREGQVENINIQVMRWQVAGSTLWIRATGQGDGGHMVELGAGKVHPDLDRKKESVNSRPVCWSSASLGSSW